MIKDQPDPGRNKEDVKYFKAIIHQMEFATNWNLPEYLIQAIADANEILISKSIYDKIKKRLDNFKAIKEIIPLKAQKVKGKEEAIDIFKIELTT